MTAAGDPPIRTHLTLVQTSPEEEAAASGGEPPETPPTAGVLVCDDHATLAKELVRELGRAVFADERFYRYDDATGIWAEVEDRELARRVQSYSRRGFMGADGKLKEMKINASDVSGTVTCAKALLDKPGFFDTAPAGLGFTNGFVVIEHGKATLRPISPDNKIRFAHPFPYDPAAKRLELDEFFEKSFEDKSEESRFECAGLIQEFAGACAFGLATDYERCLVLHGKGGQGKSQILDIIRAVLPSPDSVSSLPPHTWGEQFTIEALAGKLANIVDEIPETEIVAGHTFKGVITGEPVKAERKNQPVFVFRPRAGHIFSCNALPTTADLSEAFFDRFALLPLTRKMRGAPGSIPKAAKHVIANCLPGLVAWAIEGAERLVQDGKYTSPQECVALLANWRRDCDNVAIFLAEKTTTADIGLPVSITNGTKASAVYKSYREWASEFGFRPVSVRTFFQRASNLGMDSIQLSPGTYYGVLLA